MDLDLTPQNSNAIEISFGTSGLRGPAAGFSPQNTAAYIRAFLEVACGTDEHKTVFVAADLRDSSPRIAAICIAAIRSAGWQAVYAGNVPTPALADFALQQNCPAVMITGSHIPETYNGIKFYRRDGELMKADEAPIKARAQQILAESFNVGLSDLPQPDHAIARAYVARCVASFAPDALRGLRIGVDLHSAVGRDLLVEILEKLGASCFPFRRSEIFIAVDTEALDADDLARAKQQLAANNLDAIVSTDGDGDRPLLIDETGNQINGDVLGTLTARGLGIDVVVTPLSSTSAIEKSGWFKKVVRTRIGSPYVVAAMAEEAKAGGRIAGFEANGGFLLETDLDRPNGRLSRLPTRDALLPLIATMSMTKAQNLSVSALAATLPGRFMKADRKKEVSAEIGSAFLEAMANSAPARASLDPRLADPVDINTLDGVRLTFADNSIIHFRQSGNAPELRCYVETDTLPSTEKLLRDMMQRMNQYLDDPQIAQGTPV